MRIAKLVGEDQNPCYSRKIGVVIVNPIANRPIGMGYNGPPQGTPHCDSFDYLAEVVWPHVTAQHKVNLGIEDVLSPQTFAKKFKDCGQCPRKLLGFKSGEKSEICSCQHAERNAITNTDGNTHGCYMFCWCGIPCWECAGAVINAGITKLFITKWKKDYDDKARWLITRAGIKIFEESEDFYLENV